jgi:hypothetical protein
MKMRSNLVLLLFLLVAAGLWAQTKDKKSVKAPKVYHVPVYLGHSGVTDGSKLSKHLFDSLLLQGLVARDTANVNYTVDGFAFTYAERNLYEDSVGQLMWMTDFLTEYCYGDTLSTFLQGNITGRSKAGDTVYFDNITLKNPVGKGAIGRPIRLVLTK